VFEQRMEISRHKKPQKGGKKGPLIISHRMTREGGLPHGRDPANEKLGERRKPFQRGERIKVWEECLWKALA